MNPSDHLSIKHKSTRAAFGHSLCLSLVVALISLCASQTARAQTSYSDMWLDNTPNAVQSTDSTIEPPVDEIEADQGNLAGCGVTEDDYTSYNLYQTVTKIQSPSGVVVWGEGGVDSFSRADVSFPLDLEYAEEGSYMIETKHSEYPYDYEVQPTYDSGVGPTAIQANIFSWITRLFGGVRKFIVVYKYMNTLAVPGLEALYNYQLLCQTPSCHADYFKTYSYKKWPGFPPPYVEIRGVRFDVNFGIIDIHACLGKSKGVYFSPGCR